VRGIGHLLLDMIQEEGQLSILMYRKNMMDQIRQRWKIMGQQMKKTKNMTNQA
jgi:hypothetical protein